MGARVCFDYDAAGRKITDRWTLPAAGGTGSAGEDFRLETSYDVSGLLLGRSFPDADAVGTPGSPYTYDRAGRLLTIPGGITELSYDASGRTLVVSYASGVATTFATSATRGWMGEGRPEDGPVDRPQRRTPETLYMGAGAW